MTPNKLPPLPEPNISYKYSRMSSRDGTAHHDAFTADQMHAYAAEALRQSQSLPAVAVAGLVGKWRGEVIGLVETPRNETQRRGNALAKNYNCALTACADELEQALQADAREKGEAWPKPCDDLADFILDKLHGFSRLYRDLDHLREDLRMAIRCATPQSTHPQPVTPAASKLERALQSAYDHGVSGAPFPMVDCLRQLTVTPAGGGEVERLADHLGRWGGPLHSYNREAQERIAREYLEVAGAHPPVADAALVEAAKRIDKLSLVILSSINQSDPTFNDYAAAAILDLRSAIAGAK